MTFSTSQVATAIHKTLFFKEPVNWAGDRTVEVVNDVATTTVVSEMSDNDYETFSDHEHFMIDTSDMDAETKIDAVWVKYTGTLTTMEMTEEGSFTISHTVRSTIKNKEGGTTSLTVGGFKHELWLISYDINAADIQLFFTATGSDLKIYELMIMECVGSLDANAQYSDITLSRVDRTSLIHTDPTGFSRYETPIGAGRRKWEINYNCLFPYDTVDDFLKWSEEHVNHVFCMEFSRHPSRVFPAYFADTQISGGYISQSKGAGEQISFTIAEQ